MLGNLHVSSILVGKATIVDMKGIPLSVDVVDTEADHREKGFTVGRIYQFNKKTA